MRTLTTSWLQQDLCYEAGRVCESSHFGKHSMDWLLYW